MPGVDCSADPTCQLMQRAEFDDRIGLYVCGSTTLSPSSLFRGSPIYYGRVRPWIVKCDSFRSGKILRGKAESLHVAGNTVHPAGTKA